MIRPPLDCNGMPSEYSSTKCVKRVEKTTIKVVKRITIIEKTIRKQIETTCGSMSMDSQMGCR